ncbi:NAD(P)-dependent oxidoreductase [Rhodococcus oryzae]|uniref:NAD(P)-dependent oxidoreductase n=2 Tax=Rhodococcus oryzae TaxID=2571143 RepID=A0ABY2RJ29_9NOCA|nr:NAD(P)-dependent oxidoreductase [Rhodococcus oryzae]
MKVAIIGATGNLGGAVAREAAARGHDITPLGSGNIDVTDPDSIKAAVTGHDAVVVSVKGSDRLVPRAAEALLEALPSAGVNRVIFLGGGGSLQSESGRPFVESPDFPAQYLETALDQSEALRIFRSSETPVEWSYASPPPVYLVPGDKTGAYLVEARDTPLANENGESRITIGDYASAIVDTLETGAFVRERFTAAATD